MLTALGSENYVFDVEYGILHHKFAVVDNNKQELDPLVITGSHNWSNSANEINDENTLIIHNEDIANQYYQNFAARFKANNGLLATQIMSRELLNMAVYPNPATDILNIEAKEDILRIWVYSLSGTQKFYQKTRPVNSAKLNLDKLSPGFYFLKVELENNNCRTFKFLKK